MCLYAFVYGCVRLCMVVCVCALVCVCARVCVYVTVYVCDDSGLEFFNINLAIAIKGGCRL